MTQRTKKRLAIALAAYAILAGTAVLALDGFLRIVVFVFLASLAFRTIRAADEEPMD